MQNNEFKKRNYYDEVEGIIKKTLNNATAFRVSVQYISSAGNLLGEKQLEINQECLDYFKSNPVLIMGKTEYNKYLKEQEKQDLKNKQHEYYEKVNSIIDFANNSKELLVIKDSFVQIDTLVSQLFDKTVNSIKKIKTLDSEEWDLILDFIETHQKQLEDIVSTNKTIVEYYNSSNFQKIKETCSELMNSQRDFNNYIIEKTESISKLFGTRVVRSNTLHEDENNYLRPYQKTITPFTAEVSATVFASAENNPLEYVVKNFYPNKKFYPEQIQKLCTLIEELETLRDAKQIIDNYKKEYQAYLKDVPPFILEKDATGFYTRLGFANIDESVLTVEYKFSYTSNGGMAKRSFTVPMTEETIIELIKLLENKLSASAFVKEQRNLMTQKLRNCIKERDHFTCCKCGNSITKEPNLLLEIDHIIPVSKGGLTTEDNLQTLCWKCNRAKSNKI